MAKKKATDNPATKRKTATKPMANKPAESGVATINLTRLKRQVIEIPLIGTTPLIPHKWSEKAIRMMPGHPDKGNVKTAKEALVPEEEAESRLYRLGDQLAFPATGFKAALVGACRFFDEPSMKEAKQMFYVEGVGTERLVVIEGTLSEIQTFLPRLPNGNTYLAYGYMIENWSARIRVQFMPQRISAESIIALADAAGSGGVGDWRPSAPKCMTGVYGCWQVDLDEEVKYVA